MIYTEEDIRNGFHFSCIKLNTCEHENTQKNLKCERPEGHQGNHMYAVEWQESKMPQSEKEAYLRLSEIIRNTQEQLALAQQIAARLYCSMLDKKFKGKKDR